MSYNLKIDDILSRVKVQLNVDKIKLWLPPYKTENDNEGNEESFLKELAEKYTEKLQIDKTLCEIALKELQSHALQRIKENTAFKETGLATINVKVSGPTPQMLSVHVHLTDFTEMLIKKVAEQLKVPEQRIKLISTGKVLKNAINLGSQGVKNGMQIMAVLLAESPQELHDNDQRIHDVQDTKQALEMLAGRSNANDDFYFEIEDQSGNRLKLPLAERKALITAMGLHEKGRAALKKEDYSLALVSFLEADIEFSVCTSALLKSVDNYALLHLDIAWCYLCLGNVSHFPEAEMKLKECEANFHQSYGPNLERLLALKGTTGNEEALFMRLHLLQGIVLFHMNKHDEAKQLLQRAEAELKLLKVDEDSFCALLELGFTTAEARLGLRATSGNVDAAAEFIHKQRQERQEIEKRNRSEHKLDRKRKRLGMCSDGKQFIEPDLVNQLAAMGFTHTLAAAALKQSNNSLSLAVQLIEEQPHLLEAAIDNRNSIELLKQVVAMGFDPRMAKAALTKHNSQVESAIAELTACGGLIEGVNVDEDAIEELKTEENRRKRSREERKKAFEKVSKGMTDNADDHLDLVLTQEEIFLKQYLSLLN